MSINQVKNEEILNVFKKETVMTLKQLTALLNCSRRTTQRRLLQWGTYTSYNHNGRFYVLSSSAKFEENGLWKYKGICFSRNGNLKQTINALLHQSSEGFTVGEISKLVGVSLSSFLAQSCYFEQLRREKIDGRFVYFSSDETTFTNQKQKRQEIGYRIKLTRLPTDTEAIIILVEKIKHPDVSIEQLSKKLNQKGHPIKTESIRNLFESHGLEKKTMVT